MRRLLPLLVLLLAPAAAHAAETRCGWFYNPTPSNAWLIDGDGEWLISSQDVVASAEGDWPLTGTWVKQNAGDYGYGCTCARVETDPSAGRITRIISSKPRTLAQCRADPDLRGREPKE